jgi:hypothetical protein
VKIRLYYQSLLTIFNNCFSLRLFLFKVKSYNLHLQLLLHFLLLIMLRMVFCCCKITKRLVTAIFRLRYLNVYLAPTFVMFWHKYLISLLNMVYLHLVLLCKSFLSTNKVINWILQIIGQFLLWMFLLSFTVRL